MTWLMGLESHSSWGSMAFKGTHFGEGLLAVSSEV